MAILTSINPSDYQVLGTVPVSSLKEIKDKVAYAKKAQKKWYVIGLEKRIALLRKVCGAFKKQKEKLARIQSEEMGMLLSDALVDVDDSLRYAQWYLDNAHKYLSPETTFEDDKEIHQVCYEPIGVSAVITPWNFPFANVIWGGFQSLVAGNTIVLKHSEECPLSGKFIEEIFTTYLPEGVFSEVYGDGEVGKLLVEQDIDMIAFTGSTKTGKYLYEVAGKKFIKAVMELGGSAPAILFDDINIEAALETVCPLRLFNAGQCCDGLKRLIVHQRIYQAVVEKVSHIFAAKKVGNAQDNDTEVGPLVAKRQVRLLEQQVQDAREKGATIVTGGQSLEKELGGAFFQPTVLTHVTKDMRVWKEEVFGPVLPIVSFKTEEEAISLANDTIYGLGAYVYTKDRKRADRIATAIDSGMISMNGINYIKPSNPFGGYKSSGMGREHGKYGFSEVTQPKLIAKNK